MRVEERLPNLTVVTTSNPSSSMDNVQLVILMIMLSTFSVVGSVGNGMVIFVFQGVRDKSTAQIFIISMAVIDLFACMVIIPLTMFVEYTDYDIKFDFLCKLYHFLITSKIPMSAFIMVAIAFDRYFCICHPFKRIITVSRARNIVICLALVAGLFGVLTSLFYGVYQVVERIDSQRIDEALGPNFTQSVAKVGNIKTLDDRSERYNGVQRLLIAAIRARNFTFNGTSHDFLPKTTEFYYIGLCSINTAVFGTTLFHAYQRTYMAVYPICLITVMVLYFMIYRFMCLRRSKKLKQKLIMCSYVNGDGTYENTRLVSGDAEEERKNNKNITKAKNSNYSSTVPGTNGVSPSQGVVRTNTNAGKHGSNLLVETSLTIKNSICPTVITTAITPTDHDDNMPILNYYNNTSKENNKTTASRRQSHLPVQKYQWHKDRDSMKRYKGKTRRRKSDYSYDADRLREENRTANVRTAVMLFTVTLVFMLAFAPAWIMAHRLIHHIPAVFYLYFSYNVANPFIYAFMNHIFKEYMRQMLSCHRRADASSRTS